MRKKQIIKLNPRKCITYGRARGEKIIRYAKAMEEGANFPPVKAYRKHGAWVVTDGAHRVAACTFLGIEVLVETKSEIYFYEQDMVVK